MWEWLLVPLDPSRPHVLTDVQQLHARLMFLGWGVVAPMAIIIARYFKVLPRQDWPRILDSQVWWRTHWIGQSLVLMCTLIAIGLVLRTEITFNLHAKLGYIVLLIVIFQVALGYFRGSKGGPSAPLPDGSLAGDHYDMNRRRRLFELLHKSLGYCLLMLAMVTIAMGLWQVNSPRWMFICSTVWLALLVVVFFLLQKKGYAIDTYQAIWGPDTRHPGNRLASAGWGMRRVKDNKRSAAAKTRG